MIKVAISRKRILLECEETLSPEAVDASPAHKKVFQVPSKTAPLPEAVLEGVCAGPLEKCARESVCLYCMIELVRECRKHTSLQKEDGYNAQAYHPEDFVHDLQIFLNRSRPGTSFCVNQGVDINCVVVARALALVRRCPEGTFSHMALEATRSARECAASADETPLGSLSRVCRSSALKEHPGELQCAMALLYASIGASVLLYGDGHGMESGLWLDGVQRNILIVMAERVAFRRMIESLDYFLGVDNGTMESALLEIRSSHLKQRVMRCVERECDA